MSLLSLRGFNTLFIFLLAFFIFSSTDVNAAQLVERSYAGSNYDDVLVLNDSIFASEKGVTLKNLATRVSVIVIMLLAALGVVKIFLSRNRFGRVGSFIDDITQKVSGNFSGFSNLQGLKIKQTLILAPGQNIYLIEVEGRKLLLGATHNGGVQFLADLTQPPLETNFKSPVSEHVISEPIASPVLKNHHSLNHQFKPQDIFARQEIENPFLSIESEKIKESLEIKQEIQKENKTNQPLKRRTNFRQSLNLANVR